MKERNKFASNILTKQKLLKLLDKKVRHYLNNFLKNNLHINEQFDPKQLKKIISVIINWSIKQNARYYSFYIYSFNNNLCFKYNSLFPINTEIEYLSLVKQEVDASSFINGGLADKEHAKGLIYLFLDLPIFIYKNILYLPSILINHFSLNNILPLKKSNNLLSARLEKLLNCLGYKNLKDIQPYIGLEQELYIIKNNHYRHDLKLLHKCIVGKVSPLEPNTNNNYLSLIPNHIRKLIDEINDVLYLLGQKIKIFHHEISLHQYEISFTYDNCLFSLWQNQILKFLLNDLSSKYNLVCIFCELPFKGLSGSGKHLNYSLITSTEVNLISPKYDLNTFFVLLTIILFTIYKHQKLLIISTSSFENEYRLGVNEAPSRNISVYIEPNILDYYQKYLNNEDIIALKEIIGMNTFDNMISRNRSFSISFNANKFEFRMFGADADCTLFLILFNCVLCKTIDDILLLLNNNHDIKVICFKLFNECKDIINPSPINNTYSHYIEFIDTLTNNEYKKLFSEYAIFTYEELLARQNLIIDDYINSFLQSYLGLKALITNNILPSFYLSIALLSKHNMKMLSENNYINKIYKYIAIIDNMLINRNNLISKKDQFLYLQNKVMPFYNKLVIISEKIEKHIIYKNYLSINNLLFY